MNPAVSVAMCTYNGAQFLEEQLESLANQTLLPAELVVFDDISKDETIEILTKFASCAPFNVRIFVNKERIFHQRNFVRAAAACSSEFIAFCDQDDIWMPEKLAIMAALFTSPDIMLVAHQARLIDQTGAEIAPRLPDANFKPIYDKLTCPPWNFPRGFSQIFRNKINKFASFQDETEGFTEQDPYISHDLWTQLISNALGKVIWLDFPLTKYRQHEKNLFGLKDNLTEAMKHDAREYNSKSNNKSLIIANMFYSASNSQDLSDVRNNLITAELHWRRLASQFKFRYILYTENNLVRRFNAFICLLRLGAYGSRKTWSFSRKAALKDAFFVIFRYNYA